MAKKKSNKKKSKKKEEGKKRLLKVKLKKKVADKKENKKKDVKKKDAKKKDAKKKDVKKKDIKKKDTKRKKSNQKVKADQPLPVAPAPPKSSASGNEDHSSNYNVSDAVKKLRSLKSKEDLLSFTEGEKRITITRVIPSVMNRLT